LNTHKIEGTQANPKRAVKNHSMKMNVKTMEKTEMMMNELQEKFHGI